MNSNDSPTSPRKQLLERLALWILREIAFPIRLLRYLPIGLSLLLALLWSIGTGVGAAAAWGTIGLINEFATHQYLPKVVLEDIAPAISLLTGVLGLPFILVATAFPARLAYLNRPNIPWRSFVTPLPQTLLIAFRATTLTMVRVSYIALLLIALSIAFDAVGNGDRGIYFTTIYRGIIALAALIVLNVSLGYGIVPLVAVIGMYQAPRALYMSNVVIKGLRLRISMQTVVAGGAVWLINRVAKEQTTVQLILISVICWYFLTLISGVLVERLASLERTTTVVNRSSSSNKA